MREHLKTPLLISIHLPKTAGSSFVQSLSDHFANRLHVDYDDAPLNTDRWRRNASAALQSLRFGGRHLVDVDCIHGHFLPIKYRLTGFTRAVRFVTWMRDPVERVASHYHFWRQTYEPRSALPLHRRVVEEDWSFERFFSSPEMRNVYAQFLWGCPMSHLQFIGITEHYEEDFLYFSRVYLNATMPPHHLRANSARTGIRYVNDCRLRAEIEKMHKCDMMMYRRALELRQARIGRSRE
jgi:hypothetical protein